MSLPHRIHRAAIDVRGTTDASADTGAVRDWCVSVLLEEVDAALSEICPEEQVLVLDTLQLEVNLGNWPIPISAEQQVQLRRQIRKQLTAQTNGQEISPVPLPVYHTRILMHYLREGALPEVYPPSERTDLITALHQTTQTDEALFRQFSEVIRNEPGFARWYGFAGKNAVFEWLDAIAPLENVSWQALVNRLAELLKLHAVEVFTTHQRLLHKVVRAVIQQPGQPQRAFQFFWREYVTPYLSPERTETIDAELSTGNFSHVDKLLKTASIQSTQTPSDAKPAPSESPSKQETVIPETGVVAPVAGLVLVANFLPHFLRELGLLTVENKLVGLNRLPMLLYYIATGQTEAEEWELVVPKILCGLPLAETCDTAIDPTEAEKNEVHTLLTTIIEHWSRLRSTTPDGLRGTFLTRSGRLMTEEKRYRLDIPEETADILLSFVPWTFRFVRFSWMQKLVIVEWGK